MPTLELGKDMLLIPGDGINLSALWRLGESESGKALTPEQEADLASRFELDPEVIELLSMLLSGVLDPAKMPNLILIDRSVAEKRGEATLRRAHQEVAKTRERLIKQLHELERLTIALRAPAEASAPFCQAHASLADSLVHLEQAQESLQQALKNPGAVRLDTPTDKRRVSDQRRLLVLQTILQMWRNAGGRMTITTDTETYARGGELVEFVNAVVRCITEPPTELSGETITQALKNFLEFEQECIERARTPDDTWMEGS